MMRIPIFTSPIKTSTPTALEKDMRKNSRRHDVEAAKKIHEIRNIKNAFGGSAAQAFGKRTFLDVVLIQVAMSSRFERRQRLRRSIDRPEGLEPVSAHK